MNEIQYDCALSTYQGSSTYNLLLTVGFGFFLGLQTAPFENLNASQSSRSLLPRSYSSEGAVTSYNSMASIFTGEYVSVPEKFEQSVGNFYDRLLTSQVPLGAAFEKVLHENLWDLYES